MALAWAARRAVARMMPFILRREEVQFFLKGGPPPSDPPELDEFRGTTATLSRLLVVYTQWKRYQKRYLPRVA
jgi:hypothetical protein